MAATGLLMLRSLAGRRRRPVISGQLSVLAAGLLLAAIAVTPLMLGAGLFVSGLCASTGAQMSSLAGRYSEASRARARGRGGDCRDLGRHRSWPRPRRHAGRLVGW